MKLTFAQLTSQFEADVMAKAAELLDTGQFQPETALSRARPLVLEDWKKRHEHRKMMAEKLSVVGS